MKKTCSFSLISAKTACFTFLITIVFALGCGTDPSGIPTAAGAGTGVGGLGRGPSPVNLGTAGNYVILAESGITNIPTSAITGNVGLSPASGSFITAGVTCAQITGVIHAVDAAGPATCSSAQPSLLTTAIGDKGTAYTDAGSRAPDYTELATGNLGGLNLGPATYKWGTAVSIVADLTLTGGAYDVWIFQIAQGLSVASGVKVTLAGGALAENVYWQVVAAADLGTTSAVKGTIISSTSIVVKTGASVSGKLLAGTAVTLDQNVITKTP